MNVVLTTRAEDDLTEIYRFIAIDNVETADRVLARLFGVIHQIADGDLSGPEVRLSDGRRVRRWSVPPYRLYYRRTTRRTVVVRAYHQARRPIEH